MLQNDVENQCVIDASVEEFKDSNKIILKLVELENDELNWSTVEDQKVNEIKIPLNKDNQGRKLVKGGLSKCEIFVTK